MTPPTWSEKLARLDDVGRVCAMLSIDGDLKGMGTAGQMST